MNTRLNNFRWLLLTIALVALFLFTGCRAFQPEAVVVNRAPETFLIGAPIQGGGGYYHYHMFWYGSDEDGVVEKFVWAVTDTSVQNEDTADDEEDARFNPALDISHLEIAQWTTKNDSIFDFQINQGTAPSADMTFHMVAVDDYGDFDRTPARLYFFSNTLGTPEINFFKISGTDTIPLMAGASDTVGYRKPYHLYWEGVTPNILGYSADALAMVDTVYPYDDGLYGYKWQLGGELGGNCVPSIDDCWHPRLYNEATGDSFSYFGEVDNLLFLNNDSDDSPFGKELASGEVDVRINSLDVAGVEVADHLRSFNFLVNYDPETIILEGKDWAHADGADPDTNTYPYYTLLNDATNTHYPFTRGERIPDRSYVVFKALAKDNPNDAVVDPDFKIGLTGIVNGVRSNYTGSPYGFSSGASEIDYEPQWDAGLDGWYADTLGFLVGARTEFAFSMKAVDEHRRIDGSYPTFEFEVGYPPCVQCIEVLKDRDQVSVFTPDLVCHDPEVAGHDCFVDDHIFYIPKTGQAQQPGRVYLQKQIGSMYLAVHKNTMTPKFQMEQPEEESYYGFVCDTYSMTILLHGKDDPREAWLDARNRARGWKYQVDYECDPSNAIKDGGGYDDIISPTWGYEYGDQDISISDVDGLWKLTLNVYLPSDMVDYGMTLFRFLTHLNMSGQDDEITDELMAICLRQLSPGTIRAIVLDQADCDFVPSRPAKYHVFSTVRPPRDLEIGETWRDCYPSYPRSSSLLLRESSMDSATKDEGGNLITSEQFFSVIFEDGTDVECGWAPPSP